MLSVLSSLSLLCLLCLQSARQPLGGPIVAAWLAIHNPTCDSDLALRQSKKKEFSMSPLVSKQKCLLRAALTATALLAATALMAGSAQAAVTTYFSRADFLAAAGTAVVDSYDDLAKQYYVQPLQRTVAGLSYTASTVGNADEAAGDLFPSSSGSDIWLAPFNSRNRLRLAGFSTSVAALGGYFFGSDDLGCFAADVTLTLVVSDGGGSITQQLVNPGSDTFIGFLSSTGQVDSLTVGAANGVALPDRFATVNDLVLGSGGGPAPTTGVPEPASAALVLSALGLMQVLRRR